MTGSLVAYSAPALLIGFGGEDTSFDKRLLNGKENISEVCIQNSKGEGHHFSFIAVFKDYLWKTWSITRKLIATGMT